MSNKLNFLRRKILQYYLKLKRTIDGSSKRFLFTELGKVTPQPRIVHFELTNNCNLKCSMCERKYIWEERGKGFMNFELFKKGIKEALEMGVNRIQLNRFGESTMHPQLPEFVRYAKDMGVADVFLTSNATLLDEDLSKQLIESSLDRIAFSFEGATKETYESIREGATFEETKRNIERFLEIRSELESVKPIVRLNTVLMEETKDEIEDVKRMWGKVVDKINVQNFIKKPGLPELGIEENNREKRRICPEPALMLSVFWDGKVTVCCSDSYGELTVGDLKESGLKEIWNGREIQKLRERFLKKDYGGLVCEDCEDTFR